jgi:hypothetical protein
VGVAQLSVGVVLHSLESVVHLCFLHACLSRFRGVKNNYKK